MDIKDLMSGIAVVIDDAYEKDGSADKNDKIFELVKSIENEWKIPCYTTYEIPSDGEVCSNLFRSASFILLDWRLWPIGAEELGKVGIARNVEFLGQAKGHLVPVFIFTNENKDDVIENISNIYDKDNLGKNFIFIKNKNELLEEFSKPIEEWIKVNASIYTLKTWEQAFYKAKGNLFGAMYEKSPDWPKVFWKAYKDDGVDPSSSMTRLINDSLSGRIEVGHFEAKYLISEGNLGVTGKDIKSIIEETGFIHNDNLPDNEIRTGDLFKQQGKYLLNIRPDCDLISRDGRVIELYCIRGEKMNPCEIKNSYEKGHFIERVFESIVFPADQGRAIKFKFNNLHRKEYSEIRNARVGRIIYPHITRIQQRYASYLQRQGLPRIPKEAIETDDGT